ncbi:MAG: hypothetical protein D6722_17470 [Bacteroidetes bacterium]|nr:MAG: hypothetical protein D6722_17470 [Bacteroidota bacterium]
MKDTTAFFRQQLHERMGPTLSPEWEARLKKVGESGVGISLLSALASVGAVKGIKFAWGGSEEAAPDPPSMDPVDASEVVMAELPPETAGSLYETNLPVAEPFAVFEQAPIALSPDDAMAFGEAFAAARAEVGQGGVFMWRDQLYSTYYEAEWASMDTDDRNQYWGSIDQTSVVAQQSLAADSSLSEDEWGEMGDLPDEADMDLMADLDEDPDFDDSADMSDWL